MKKMKQIFCGMLILCMLMALTACGSSHTASSNTSSAQGQSSAQTENTEAANASEIPAQTTETGTDSQEGENSPSDSNILIAYFAVAENSDVDAVSSASVTTEDGEAKGLVRVLAEAIQSEVGGDLFSIQTSVDYPGDINNLIDYAAEEQDENARPELTSQIENLDDYDVIFVGYPNWWYDMPMVMYSFFETYDFAGKTIIPFNSHNGSRFSSTIETIQELEPEATVITDGFTVNQSGVTNAAGDIADWLRELGY